MPPNAKEASLGQAIFALIRHPLFIAVIGPIVGFTLAYFFIHNPQPDIEPTIIYNTGSSYETSIGPFKLEEKIDPTAWCIVNVANKGDTPDEDLEVEFQLSKTDNMIVRYSKTYDPPLLSGKIRAFDKTERRFYENIGVFPSASNIEYKLILKGFIKSENDYLLFVCSKHKNWSKSKKVSPRFSKALLPQMAYAEEKESRPNVPKPGISIGGYDPIVMSNELFRLLQDRKLITKDDAREIKTIIESYKEGILFGGINILKFNELVINKLLSNNRITRDQANFIIDKSRSAGGVLVGGFNVIVLEVETLNSLLKNNQITFEEGQKVIDSAKVPEATLKESEKNTKETPKGSTLSGGAISGGAIR
jgi:hypothetical protein